MKLFGFELSRIKSPATRFFGDLVKVNLEPGDVCVLMSRRALTKDESVWLRDTWRASVGEQVTLIVLDDGMRMGVLSPPEALAVHERLSDEVVIAEAIAE